jgi:hypothetical protein
MLEYKSLLDYRPIATAESNGLKLYMEEREGTGYKTSIYNYSSGHSYISMTDNTLEAYAEFINEVLSNVEFDEFCVSYIVKSGRYAVYMNYIIDMRKSGNTACMITIHEEHHKLLTTMREAANCILDGNECVLYVSDKIYRIHGRKDEP